MRRAFDIDVLACPRCGGRLRLIATVEDPDAIRAILANVGVLRELAERAPPFAARGTSATARRSAPERHPGAASVPARPRSLLGRFHPWSSAPLSGRDRLTGRLSALYRGAEPGRSDLPRTSVPSNSAFVPSMLWRAPAGAAPPESGARRSSV